MKLSLGFSPCPNDTFIFDAMIHGKVDTEGLKFEVSLDDVEALNQKAFTGQLDITKLSYHAYTFAMQEYVLLHSGSALGNNCGPLLIAKQKISEQGLQNAKIAIPGKYTTANFLLSLAFPKNVNRVEMLFSEIEDAVLKNKVDAGLIIHENRFTYQDKGLVKLVDLGEYWESSTRMPIPLGGIVIKRTFSAEVQEKVNRVLKRSVRYALDQPEQTLDYVSRYAQEMDPGVMMQHIGLYVNDYTVDLGKSGKQAVEKMYQIAEEKQLMKKPNLKLFID